MELHTLTLNCWGLPLGLSKDKPRRIQQIAEQLSRGGYDIVALQEIWVLDDYKLIKSTVEKSLPHSFYFKRGILNSGLCVFSRWPIVDTACHCYSLNGYPHKFTQMDWYASKMAALCRIDAEGMMVNVYNTHVHALYAPSDDPEKDEFLAHRLVQLYELSQFVRLTSATADVVLMMGDLNTEPFSLAFQLALANAGLSDAWDTKENTEYQRGTTCERGDNKLATGQTLYYRNVDGQGMRIDYILYRTPSSRYARCLEMTLDLRFIPGMQDARFSDHEGVRAKLAITTAKADAAGGGDAIPVKQHCHGDHMTIEQITSLIQHLTSAISLLTAAKTKSKAAQTTSLLKALLCFALLLVSIAIQPSYPIITLAWNVVLTLLTAFFFCFGLVVQGGERNTLTGAINSMRCRLQYIQNQCALREG